VEAHVERVAGGVHLPGRAPPPLLLDRPRANRGTIPMAVLLGFKDPTLEACTALSSGSAGDVR
jgi:hypothetical protein